MWPDFFCFVYCHYLEFRRCMEMYIYIHTHVYTFCFSFTLRVSDATGEADLPGEGCANPSRHLAEGRRQTDCYP